MGRSAVIAGATGLVGGACLRELLRDGEYERVFAIVRKPLGISDSRLTEVRGDADHIPDFQPLNAATVFCAIGTTIRKAGSQAAFRRVDFDYPLGIAKAALAAGASEFVLVSSVGADAKSGNFYLRVKGELEDALGALRFRALHILRPSVLMGDRQESRPGERAGIAVARAAQFLLIGGLSKYRPVEAEEVGRAMVGCAKSRMTGKQIHHWREIRSYALQ